MSVTQYPEGFNAADLQIWNNAAFDRGESEDSTAIKASWSRLQYVDRSDSSIQSDCSKENQVQSPVLVKSPVFAIPVKPLQVNSAIVNAQANQIKIVSKQGLVDKSTTTESGSEEGEEKVRDQRKIDMEIEEIEREISRLSSRLEALRIEKLEQGLKSIEKRGRIVPAKFMEQKQSKQSTKNSDAVKKIEENSLLSSKMKIHNRRGVSLGPADIFSAVKSRQSMLLTSKPELTPIMSTQSRRKSCFFKLEGIDEAKVTKERGKSLSVSPKSRKMVPKIQAPKQAMTTVGSKRPVKKEDGVISSIQPKKLFNEGEKSAPAKKPIKPGRVVASRYNQISNQASGNSTTCEARKRSLPENGKDESNKRRASNENGVETCRSLKSESNRVKKKWEIPSEVVVFKGLKEEEAPVSVSKIGDVLPKIRTARYVNDSPRDSGAAKRVAELVGRKSYFGAADEGECRSVCQALKFEEGEEDAEEYSD